jgi:hypothetical protein
MHPWGTMSWTVSWLASCTRYSGPDAQTGPGLLHAHVHWEWGARWSTGDGGGVPYQCNSAKTLPPCECRPMAACLAPRMDSTGSPCRAPSTDPCATIARVQARSAVVSGSLSAGGASGELLACLLTTNPRMAGSDVATIATQRLQDRTVLLDHPTARAKASEMFARWRLGGGGCMPAAGMHAGARTTGIAGTDRGCGARTWPPDKDSFRVSATQVCIASGACVRPPAVGVGNDDRDRHTPPA